MIGIIGALDSEVSLLKEQMQNTTAKTIGTTDFFSGTLWGKAAVVAKSGVGKVNAALCAQNMIHFYAPRLIINTGCAAGVGDGLQVGDIVLASAAVQHDLEYGQLNDKRGHIDGIDRIFIPADKAQTECIAAIAESLGVHTRIGIIATGDQFLCDPLKKDDIKSHFGAEAVEMEGGAIAHTACANAVPFVILRSVSDNGDESASENFEAFSEKVNLINLKILKKYLQEVS